MKKNIDEKRKVEKYSTQMAAAGIPLAQVIFKIKTNIAESVRQVYEQKKKEAIQAVMESRRILHELTAPLLEESETVDMSAAVQDYNVLREDLEDKHGESVAHYAAQKREAIAAGVGVAKGDYKPIIAAAVIFFVLILLESVINANMFAEADPRGLAGGALAAAQISLLSVFYSFGAGWLFRSTKDTDNYTLFIKAACYSIFLFWLTSLCAFHVYVGWLRTSMVHLPDTAWESSVELFITNGIYQTNGKSWLLTFVGVIFGFIAFHDGYKFNNAWSLMILKNYEKALENAKSMRLHNKQAVLAELKRIKDRYYTTADELFEEAKTKSRKLAACRAEALTVASEMDNILREAEIQYSYLVKSAIGAYHDIVPNHDPGPVEPLDIQKYSLYDIREVKNLFELDLRDIMPSVEQAMHDRKNEVIENFKQFCSQIEGFSVRYNRSVELPLTEDVYRSIDKKQQFTKMKER